MKPLELAGQQFFRLTVVKRARPRADGAVWWECLCSCGNKKEFRGADLKRGFIKSCGCWNREVVIKRNKTHGRSHTRLYRIWQAMRDRTGNPRNSRFKYYGERGITVCPDWQEFEPFAKWADANGYADNLSIDRIDVNGNYEPSNCRWATQAVQVQNRRPLTQLTTCERSST